jgi:hypothetical protein
MKYAVLIAAFGLLGSAAGWAGQEVWSPIAMALALILGAAVSATFAYQRKLADRALRPWPIAIVWGLVLGIGLWFAGVQLWSINDVILNSDWRLGVERIRDKSLLGAALGLALGAAIALHVRKPKHRWARWVRRVVLAGWLSALIVALTLYVLRTGVSESDIYPSHEESPYVLPWPGGMTWTCIQGNRAIVSHHSEWDKYAYNFAMPIGSPVAASRDGVVVDLVDDFDGNGLDKPSNYLRIRHGDGTYADYGHIRQHGDHVRIGDRVRQGQIIAESGNVGFSTSPHLHFEVYIFDGQWRSIPVTFRDVPIRSGIPRMWLRYTSGNFASW